MVGRSLWFNEMRPVVVIVMGRKPVMVEVESHVMVVAESQFDVHFAF